MAHWKFAGSDPINASISIAAGNVALAAQPADATTVEITPSRPGRNDERLLEAVRVSFDHGRLTVTGPKHSGLWRGFSGLNVTVTVPPGSRATVRTASADVSCTGELAELDARTASGDVTAARVAGPARADTASGDLWLEETTGGADLHTASGDIRLARAGGDVSVHTASGEVSIGSAAGSVEAQTASGDVRIASAANGRTEVTTVSGDVLVGVAAGAGVYLDLASVAGTVSSQLDETEEGSDITLTVKCRTVSGGIRITRGSTGEPGSRSPASHLPAPATADDSAATG